MDNGRTVAGLRVVEIERKLSESNARMSLEDEIPELKPCPFCGSGNIDPREWLRNDGVAGPGCSDCGATAHSVAEWNRRVAEGMAAPGDATERARTASIRQAMYLAFTKWFETGGVDFWRESDAPEHLSEVGANIAASLTAAEDGALRHLGNALYTVSDLRLDYRSEALDEAQRFYNAARPNAVIEPSGYPAQRLITDCEIADIKAAAEDGARRAALREAASIVRSIQGPTTGKEIAEAILALATKATPTPATKAPSSPPKAK